MQDPASDGEVSDDTASLSPSFNSQDGIVDSSRVTNGVQKLKLSAEHAVSRPQIRVVIDLNRVGAFIGKGGEAIKQLARESGTIMGVEALVPGSESRVVTITTAAEGEEAAATLVAGLTAAAAAITAGDKPSDSPLRLLVPGAHIGQLLGKGGATIAAIRRDSGADIKILPRGELPPAARVSDELVTTALRLLVPAEAVGGLVGRGGEHIERVRRETGATVRVVDGASRDAPAVVLATSVEDAAAPHCAAQEALARAFLAVSGEEAGGRHEAVLRLPAAAAGSLLGRKGATVSALRAETGAAVHVGALMGKGGANISQVRSVSGARVHLSPATEGEPGATRALEVSGPVEAVLAARNMVNAFLAVGGCSEAQPV
ncbi:Poly(rC)-binding protein 3 [Auxenochlorella protothecoides]|uniref:Poly(RC)-binding protein 3 n=1 Tax=Auxenochlorella protothecoides TaxID=3075 RepID=A0A087SPE7_AUXPR|nr:Poly(rC)-binding protein 3 [Auxenochlorella protothecoides]KFM27601.1 Poly(rC)-binding protein 3 [Auxenochlorella protothecoides]